MNATQLTSGYPLPVICSWCLREQNIQPQAQDSHGICSRHRKTEYERFKEARNPVYGTCGHLAKDAGYSCGSPRCSQYSW
jgi:hypothetical protein